MARIKYNGQWINVQNEGHDTKTTIDQYVGVGDEKQSRGIERPEQLDNYYTMAEQEEAHQPINQSNGS